MVCKVWLVDACMVGFSCDLDCFSVCAGCKVLQCGWCLGYLSCLCARLLVSVICLVRLFGIWLVG